MSEPRIEAGLLVRNVDFGKAARTAAVIGPNVFAASGRPCGLVAVGSTRSKLTCHDVPRGLGRWSSA